MATPAATKGMRVSLRGLQTRERVGVIVVRRGACLVAAQAYFGGTACVPVVRVAKTCGWGGRVLGLRCDQLWCRFWRRWGSDWRQARLGRDCARAARRTRRRPRRLRRITRPAGTTAGAIPRSWTRSIRVRIDSRSGRTSETKKGWLSARAESPPCRRRARLEARRTGYDSRSLAL